MPHDFSCFIMSLLYKMEHATGIEPARLAWEAKVLPLNYACIYFVKKPFIRANSLIWWVLTGSNRRPSVRQTDALPAELNTHLCWCRLQELNPQPTDYDSVALPIELSRQV